MPELLIPLFLLYLLYLYFPMKKPTTSTEKPVSKPEQPASTVESELKAKITSPTPKPPTKPKSVTPKAVTKEKAEKPVAVADTKPKVTKSSQSPKSSKKVEDSVSTQDEITPQATMSVRVGLTAGSIWHYLSENGPTSVTKLVRALPEEEKIIQRSIGWLAQEGKVTLETIDKVETIGLSG